jgi:CheY-like chemotaxis protein
MSASSGPTILGIDENRDAQQTIAAGFNARGLFYRFVSDRRQIATGLTQLKPNLLVLHAELASNFAIQVLDTLSTDVASARIPVIVIANDVNDAAFVQGFRTGVTALLQAPFSDDHIVAIQALWNEIPSRNGVSSGQVDSAGLARLVDHLRRTRRSGVLLSNPRTSTEGKASFVYGKLDQASFLAAHGQPALDAMLKQGQVRWSFTEVDGAQSDGAGVVIEVGEVITGEQPVGEVIDIAPPPPPSGSRILLVDDDAAILTMFSRLFTKHGFTVSIASDGDQGRELAATEAFDVVLADLNMPHLDGWGMLRALRDDFRTRELPLAFLSAHDDYRESLKAADAGAQAYLSKGTKLDAIVSHIQKLLEPRRSVLAALELKQTENIAIHAVGPQWLSRQIAAQQKTGVLIAKDGWATYTLGFEYGALTSASGVAGQYTAQSDRAINAFVASRSAQGSFDENATPPPANLDGGDTEAVLMRAVDTLNENERRIRDNVMLSATQITVNEALYKVYRDVGPKDTLELVRLVCEEKLMPREIISRLDTSPLEIEECLKDLLRRGVVTLKNP